MLLLKTARLSPYLLECFVADGMIQVDAMTTFLAVPFSSKNILFFQEKSYLYRTSLYLAASASAEFFADIALAPMEACKVRIQTQPGFANTLREAFPKIWKHEGASG